MGHSAELCGSDDAKVGGLQFMLSPIHHILIVDHVLHLTDKHTKHLSGWSYTGHVDLQEHGFNIIVDDYSSTLVFPSRW